MEQANERGLKFKVKVSNGTDGHGVPTGFDAEREVFLRTTVTDSEGKVVFKSGDLDPNGDVRNENSAYVHNGELPLDKQLFSLQTKFLVRNIRGGEREQVLPVPYTLDPLPYVRPETRPHNVLGRPIAARKQKQNLAANGGYRYADYEVKPEELCGKGPYVVDVKLIAGMVPVNLVNEIQSVGFDYGMSPRQIANNIVAGHLVLHEQSARSSTYPKGPNLPQRAAIVRERGPSLRPASASRGAATPMATHHRKRRGTRHRVWAASIAAALSLSGAAAWRNRPNPCPPGRT